MAISRIGTDGIAPSQTLTTPIIATTMGVGGATPSNSGSGITFPATQSASTDVNTLDDYEEGAWTPTIGRTSTNPTVVYTTQAGRYVKIGRMVFVSGHVNWSANSGGSGGGWTVTGLPFTVSSESPACYSQIQILDQSNITYQTSGTYFGGYASTGTTYIYLISGGNGLTSNNITLNSTGNFYFSGSYLTST